MTFWEWIKSLFVQEKAAEIPTGAKDEKEEALTSPTYGVQVKSSNTTISSGIDPDEGELPWYYRMYINQCFRAGKESTIINAVREVVKNRSRYERVEKLTGVPWYVIGAIHYKEGFCDFTAALHNGDKVIGNNKLTYRVPKGRGPFATWEDAAVDAIKLNGGRWAKIKSGAKDVASILYACERYNGTGHIKGAGKAAVSPYLWDCTTVYSGRGRYVADGKWDPNFVGNKSAGLAGMLRYMEAMKVINISGDAMKDVGPIPESPKGGDVGAGLLETTPAHLKDAMTLMIAQYKREKPGKNARYWAIFDVSAHSKEKRFYLFDRETKALDQYHVAHGSGSDPDHNGIADRFSNTSGSNMTSLGFYLTAETYIGKHGLSLKLDGKDTTNSNARARAVVLHGAEYVEADYIKTNGKAGRSQGCPAVAQSLSKDLVQKLAGGSPLLIVKSKG